MAHSRLQLFSSPLLFSCLLFCDRNVNIYKAWRKANYTQKMQNSMQNSNQPLHGCASWVCLQSAQSKLLCQKSIDIFWGLLKILLASRTTSTACFIVIYLSQAPTMWQVKEMYNISWHSQRLQHCGLCALIAAQNRALNDGSWSLFWHDRLNMSVSNLTD